MKKSGHIILFCSEIIEGPNSGRVKWYGSIVDMFERMLGGSITIWSQTSSKDVHIAKELCLAQVQSPVGQDPVTFERCLYSSIILDLMAFFIWSSIATITKR
jgi:hypothetical protein